VPDDRRLRGLLAPLFLLAVLLLPPRTAWAVDVAMPPLTGRVVDGAALLTPEQRQALSEKLKAHEDKTSDQVVVATVRTLGGLSVEDYANRLFRTWGLGQKKTNNGVLLLVAPNDRKMRIEVGYGLEGALTDALSKVILATAVAPRFKAGDWNGGLDAGVEAILSVLSGDAQEWQRRAEVREDSSDNAQFAMFFAVFVVIMIVFAFMGGRRRRGRGGFGDIIVLPGPSGGWSGGLSGGGGFSGGGGSSGGGGASFDFDW